MRYIQIEIVLDIHEDQIKCFGGLPGIRDLGLLNSAIEMPKMACFGKELYETVFSKAAAYLYFIVKNHPFNDGNKRTALAVSLTFLEVNDIKTNFDPKELEEFVVHVASDQISLEEIILFLSS